ncbi:hypothetical protein COCC4DRAFT_59850 [Bipolaris maydis ATCC 48331]|uniref:Uncharacterized protein n=2 Tax=Cochliobolus heterostrophus TaxID=5016 RepID=M2TIU1_COCH5|nr:uncharacterized protein COCC4DRAFT_59850 [Bipolaris maydis ATCC 48331]EMD86424.1 hypothetical protein COCHEDRAFT_1034859 [Bipolaris maydis C5]ENI06375.1 hypothetical protein COCC4DRAFT_59850 [Bipolaris maydis ATCC 48331]KAJ6214041.1 hypothetical protein PSV09DRAFT_1034859 [Bipolaris maydis]
MHQGRLLSQGSETQTAALSQVGWWAKGNTRGSCARRSSQADCPAPSAVLVIVYAAVYNLCVCTVLVSRLQRLLPAAAPGVSRLLKTEAGNFSFAAVCNTPTGPGGGDLSDRHDGSLLRHTRTQEQFRAANYRRASRPLGPLTEAPVPALRILSGTRLPWELLTPALHARALPLHHLDEAAEVQHGHAAPATPVARHRCCWHISSRQNMSTLCHPAFCGTTSLVNDPIRAFGTNPRPAPRPGPCQPITRRLHVLALAELGP